MQAVHVVADSGLGLGGGYLGGLLNLDLDADDEDEHMAQGLGGAGPMRIDVDEVGSVHVLPGRPSQSKVNMEICGVFYSTSYCMECLEKQKNPFPFLYINSNLARRNRPLNFTCTAQLVAIRWTRTRTPTPTPTRVVDPCSKATTTQIGLRRPR